MLVWPCPLLAHLTAARTPAARKNAAVACADGVDFGNKVLQQQVHMEIYLKVLLEVLSVSDR